MHFVPSFVQSIDRYRHTQTYREQKVFGCCYFFLSYSNQTQVILCKLFISKTFFWWFRVHTIRYFSFDTPERERNQSKHDNNKKNNNNNNNNYKKMSLCVAKKTNLIKIQQQICNQLLFIHTLWRIKVCVLTFFLVSFWLRRNNYLQKSRQTNKPWETSTYTCKIYTYTSQTTNRPTGQPLSKFLCLFFVEFCSVIFVYFILFAFWWVPLSSPTKVLYYFIVWTMDLNIHSFRLLYNANKIVYFFFLSRSCSPPSPLSKEKMNEPKLIINKNWVF